MAARAPAVPSQKLQNILKDFQQMASMAGYVNHSYDLPQLRLMFTLYGRVKTATEEEALAAIPKIQGWAEALGTRMREDSSAAILPPQVLMGNPQPTDEGYLVVGTVTFNTKVTEHSYLRTRTAVLAAYQEAVRLREKGFSGLA